MAPHATLRPVWARIRDGLVVVWPARLFVLGPQLARAAVCGLYVGFGCSGRNVGLQAPRSVNGPVDAPLGLRGTLAQFFHAALTFEFEAQLKGVEHQNVQVNNGPYMPRAKGTP